MLFFSERLKGEARFLLLGQLEPHLLLVAFCGSTSSLVRCGWIQNRIYKDLAGFIPQMQNFEVFDRIRRRFLSASNYELSYGCATQCCCALDKTFLFRSDSSFQALFLSRLPTLLYACHDCPPISLSVRRLGGQINRNVRLLAAHSRRYCYCLGRAISGAHWRRKSNTIERVVTLLASSPAVDWAVDVVHGRYDGPKNYNEPVLMIQLPLRFVYPQNRPQNEGFWMLVGITRRSSVQI